MRISVEDLRRYRETMQSIASEASAYVREAIESVGDGAGMTEVREAAILALQDSVGIHGDWAQALAGQLFADVCASEGLGEPHFEIVDDAIDFAMLEERVRYTVQWLAEHDGMDRFIDDCSVLAEMYSWRVNRDSMIRNCERNGIRYARVPTSGNPCEWCAMLASRGFVYHSSDNAEASSHAHCQCVVVPGGPNTTVDGYDPDALYDQWQDSIRSKAEDRARRNGTSVEVERANIMDGYRDAAMRAKARRRK